MPQASRTHTPSINQPRSAPGNLTSHLPLLTEHVSLRNHGIENRRNCRMRRAQAKPTAPLLLPPASTLTLIAWNLTYRSVYTCSIHFAECGKHTVLRIELKKTKPTRLWSCGRYLNDPIISCDSFLKKKKHTDHMLRLAKEERATIVSRFSSAIRYIQQH